MSNHLLSSHVHTSQQLPNTTSVEQKDVLHCMLSSHNSLDQLCMIPMEFREETMLLDLTVQSGSGSATAAHTTWATSTIGYVVAL